ncbi:MAG: hypothetical protein K2X99_00340, partial [Gemmatimonadaceae bacterium]|nr:hypothetical protein [Gemmatimonadaceae bacterium]
MRRWCGLAVCGGLLVTVGAAHAQVRWDDPATLTLVDRAIARRSRQLADSTLKDYAAVAHGYVTFLAQLGDGFADPPKVIRTDELAVEVYWRAPDRSKQRIIGRRDTTLVPTDLAYHRDHLVIVQGNFPEIIRLGDGDEVRDVPHPLSAAGRAAYEFAIVDSLPIRTSDRAIDVIEVALRPRDPRRPAAIGSVFLERASATVVRLALTFTRAALRDPALDDVAVILENGLVDGTYWLPRRQEIEIRRTGSVLDFPARGIIRGRWEITEVRPNLRLPEPVFAGAEIVQLPRDSLRAYRFAGAILDALPSTQRAVEPRDVERVQQRARELVAVRALERGSGTAVAARRLSELVRFNRNEGLALGAGLTQTLSSAFTIGGAARFGFSDHRAKGRVELGWRGATTRLRLGWLDDLAEAGTVAEASGLRNTIAAQEFGTDLTALYRVRGAQLAFERRRESGARLRLAVARESQRAARVTATPARGRFAPALAATAL